MNDKTSVISKRSTVRNAVPLVLAMAGLWLLAGCFYLPFPEVRVDKTQQDFRDLLGRGNSKRPIRPGVVTRAQVVALLGEPLYASRDGTAIGYVMVTKRGYWVMPLCFAAEPAEFRTYGVRLVFGGDGRLLNWDVAHEDRNAGFMFGSRMPNYRMPKFKDEEPEMVPVR